MTAQNLILDAQLSAVRQFLIETTDPEEKIGYLAALPVVRAFLERPSFLKRLFDVAKVAERLALLQFVAIGEAERFAARADGERGAGELIRFLAALDYAYREIGGVVGYHWEVVSRLRQARQMSGGVQFSPPPFIDISEKTAAVEEAIQWGIDATAHLAEIYPIGGAADRLHLVDDATGQELPAAKLPFLGVSLLARLVRDVEARERLYWKERGKRVWIPIAMMTSWEKENHRHVLEILEENRWFGRSKELFRLFTQPLVPALDEGGGWYETGSYAPLLKPGGHGVIWKLARDEGIFAWLASLGKRQALVRQINNPVAGLDYGLLAFSGHGWKKKMAFGFASCPRLLRAAEGVNVLKIEGGKRAITNIEYCDFGHYGIEDAPLKADEPYSRFSSNTNVLFADLEAVEEAIGRCPFPGLLINLKKGSYLHEKRGRQEGWICRLESTMQNIADELGEEQAPAEQSPLGASGGGLKRTFVTYNFRHKTIATAKKAFVPGGSLLETPEHCAYELHVAMRELLGKVCGARLPAPRSVTEVVERGPEFHFSYRPSLGPLYSEIGEKLRRIEMEEGGACQIEIAECRIDGLALQGALAIVADREGESECLLRTVRVENRGIDWAASLPYWKGSFRFLERAVIRLKGRSRLIAEGVVWRGAFSLTVEDGEEVRVTPAGITRTPL